MIFSFLLSGFFPVSTSALNNTTQTWTFDTANAPSYTYDTSFVTVDDTGGHPISGVNKLVNPSFVSDNSSWSVSAVLPTGWVEVPGNDSLYGTSNFLVMKYEAKCADFSAPTTGLISPTVGYGDYNDSGTNGVACTAANNRQVVSVASGYPIASITQTASLDRCQSITLGSTNPHLISNDEWMTITRNIEVQDANWTLGETGQGHLYAGHNDGAPLKALPASSNDSGNYTCAYTDGANPNEENPAGNCPTNTASATSGTAGLQRRTHILSNNATIWDTAGNMHEWTSTNLTCAGTNCTVNEMPYGVTSGLEWLEYASGATGWSGDVLSTYGAYTWDDLGPSNHTYNSDQGMGRLYSDNNAAYPSGTTHAFLRGGWYNSSLTGVFTLHLYYAPSFSLNSFGLRCASDPVAISQSWSSSSGREAAGGDTVIVGDVSDAKLSQVVNVEDTDTYDFSVYIYNNTSGEEGDPVDSDVAELYYGGNSISDVAYTPIVGETGWYQLTGTITGIASDIETGLIVKTGKTVIVDDFTLAKQGTYSAYTTQAYDNEKLVSWDSFTPDETASGNAGVYYQICLDDGVDCGYASGSRWQYYTGSVWTDSADATIGSANIASQLTTTAMQALPIASQKLSVKAIFTFGGVDIPALNSIALGLTADTEAPTGTISINSGETITNTDEVTLTLSATDNLSGISKMMVSNKGDYSGGTWETYNTSKEWRLSMGDGEKRVYVKYRDEVGNISSSNSDSIEMDMGAPTGTLIINEGEEYTSSREVVLHITGEDSVTGVEEMRISEERTMEQIEWEGYETSREYTLSEGDGYKVIYIQYRDGIGNESEVYGSNITLDRNTEIEVTEIGEEEVEGEIENWETEETTPTFTGEGEVGATITIEIEGIETGTVIVNEDGVWSWTPSIELTRGQEYNVIITSRDLAGNEDTQTFTLGISDEEVIEVSQITPEAQTTTTQLPNTGVIFIIGLMVMGGLLWTGLNFKVMEKLGRKVK